MIWAIIVGVWPSESGSTLVKWFWRSSSSFSRNPFLLNLVRLLFLLFATKNCEWGHDVANHQKSTWAMNWTAFSTPSSSFLLLSLFLYFLLFSICEAVRKRVASFWIYIFRPSLPSRSYFRSERGRGREGRREGKKREKEKLKITHRSSASVPGSLIQSWVLTGQEVLEYKLGCWIPHPCVSVD